jgi:hypothetical protein
MTIFGPWATVSAGTSPENTTSTDKKPHTNKSGSKIVRLN